MSKGYPVECNQNSEGFTYKLPALLQLYDGLIWLPYSLALEILRGEGLQPVANLSREVSYCRTLFIITGMGFNILAALGLSHVVGRLWTVLGIPHPSVFTPIGVACLTLLCVFCMLIYFRIHVRPYSDLQISGLRRKYFNAFGYTASTPVTIAPKDAAGVFYKIEPHYIIHHELVLKIERHGARCQSVSFCDFGDISYRLWHATVDSDDAPDSPFRILNADVASISLRLLVGRRFINTLPNARELSREMPWGMRFVDVKLTFDADSSQPRLTLTSENTPIPWPRIPTK